MLTEQQVKQWMHPHIHTKSGARYYCNGGLVDCTGLKHGDKVGSGIFRVMDNDLYADEFYQEALPIAKRIWGESSS